MALEAQKAKELARSLYLKTLPHLQVGPRMRKRVLYRDGVLEIEGDRVPLHSGRPVRVVALGKAATEMAHTLAEILSEVRLRGVVAAPAVPKFPLPGFEYFAGGHPYPNEESWRAAEAALALLDQKNVTEDDLVIFLISGGGSSLLEMPPLSTQSRERSASQPPMTLEDLQKFYELLITCGANIEEINTVRKRFSAVKGGQLAAAASQPKDFDHPTLVQTARQITLYVSDVPEHLPSMIASGPTFPDGFTLDECRATLWRYHLWERLPASYRACWESGRVSATPKSGAPCFERSLYYCLLANSDAVEKLAELAEAAGIVVEIDNHCDDWNFQKAADYLLDALRGLRKDNPGKAVAIVSGGELSCPVGGDGMGGRNQAFVLDCVRKIAGTPIVVLSAGTDGIDGNSPAAGAIADGQSLERARALGLYPEDFQRHSDSFHFFEKLGDAIITGPTGTNVRDLRILLSYPE